MSDRLLASFLFQPGAVYLAANLEEERTQGDDVFVAVGPNRGWWVCVKDTTGTQTPHEGSEYWERTNVYLPTLREEELREAEALDSARINEEVATTNALIASGGMFRGEQPHFDELRAPRPAITLGGLQPTKRGRLVPSRPKLTRRWPWLAAGAVAGVGVVLEALRLAGLL